MQNQDTVKEVPASQGNMGEPEQEEHTEGSTAAAPVSEQKPPGAPLPRYDYDKTSIILVAHFRPVTQDGSARQVWLSAQNGVGNEQDCPLYLLLTEADLGGPWPPAVAQLLENLRDDLPTRKLRYETRQARPAPVPSTSAPSTQKTALKLPPTGKSEKSASRQPPPVPTTTTPIPKQGLAMGGLFDGLE